MPLCGGTQTSILLVSTDQKASCAPAGGRCARRTRKSFEQPSPRLPCVCLLRFLPRLARTASPSRLDPSLLTLCLLRSLSLLLHCRCVVLCVPSAALLLCVLCAAGGAARYTGSRACRPAHCVLAPSSVYLFHRPFDGSGRGRWGEVWHPSHLAGCSSIAVRAVYCPACLLRHCFARAAARAFSTATSEPIDCDSAR